MRVASGHKQEGDQQVGADRRGTWMAGVDCVCMASILHDNRVGSGSAQLAGLSGRGGCKQAQPGGVSGYEWGRQVSMRVCADTMVCVHMRAHAPMQWWVSLAMRLGNNNEYLSCCQRDIPMGMGTGHSGLQVLQQVTKM